MDKAKSVNPILEPNTASAMCYIPFVGFIPAIIFLVIHKDKRVRWNAIQALLVYMAYAAIYFALLPLLKITIILIPLALLIGGLAWVGFMILWLVLAAKASQGQDLKLPYAGKWADMAVRK